MNGNKFFTVDHATQDIAELAPVILLLKNAIRLTALKTKPAVMFKTIALQLDGMLDFLKIAFPDSYSYLCVWLMDRDFISVDYFPQVIVDVLAKRASSMTIASACTYLSRWNDKLEVTYEGCGSKRVNGDVIEVLKNAFKYAKSYINVSIQDALLVIENDVGDVKSGTKKGLVLHGIELVNAGDTAVSKVQLPTNNREISWGELDAILQQCGMLHVQDVNGKSSSYNDDTLVGKLSNALSSFSMDSAIGVCSICSRDYPHLLVPALKDVVIEFIKEVFSENIESNGSIVYMSWAGEYDGQGLGVNITIGSRWYGWSDYVTKRFGDSNDTYRRWIMPHE